MARKIFHDLAQVQPFGHLRQARMKLSRVRGARGPLLMQSRPVADSPAEPRPAVKHRRRALQCKPRAGPHLQKAARGPDERDEVRVPTLQQRLLAGHVRRLVPVPLCVRLRHALHRSCVNERLTQRRCRQQALLCRSTAVFAQPCLVPVLQLVVWVWCCCWMYPCGVDAVLLH